MPITGRSFQFSIGSILSFHFRAGFAPTYYARPQAEDRIKSHQAQEVIKAEAHSVDAMPSEDSDFYEVVGPYSEGSATYTHRGAPATIALPAGDNLMSTEIPSRGRHFADFYANETGTHQEFAKTENSYMHSYNHNGQGVYPAMETFTIDLVV